MINSIKKILKLNMKAIPFTLKYLFRNSLIIVFGKIELGGNTKIINSKIHISDGSRLVTGENVTIKDAILYIKGECYIDSNTVIEKGYQFQKTQILITGKMICRNNSRIRAKIWIRFGGVLEIGSYTAINEGTEIRVDEHISIGSYNMISYKCVIWDTNTHNIYSDEKRRNLTIKYFPQYGYEYEKPQTKPVYIGNDCWLGEEVSILKGTKINNGCIIGYRTVLSNCEIEADKVAVSRIDNAIFSKDYKINNYEH